MKLNCGLIIFFAYKSGTVKTQNKIMLHCKYPKRNLTNTLNKHFVNRKHFNSQRFDVYFYTVILIRKCTSKGI